MNEQDAFLGKHLQDTAKRASAMGIPLFSPFLSPAEMAEAERSARAYRIPCRGYGGYPDAERQIACFGECEDTDYPIVALELSWPHQPAPGHRDLLGSVLALGFKRSLIGDIVLQGDCAFLFAQSSMAELIARQWCSAGRTQLQVRLLETVPPLSPQAGEEKHCTVMSLRLDAVLAGGWNLSRTSAATLISSGRVKRNHLLCLKPDEKLNEGDVLSVSGYGRLVLCEIGRPTKKARLPLRLARYGSNNGNQT